MAKEIWTTKSEFGHGSMYTISFRTKFTERLINELVMTKLIVPVPGSKINIDECPDDQKVVVQSLGYFDEAELKLLYWEIQRALTV